jgi:hypothetical protein
MVVKNPNVVVTRPLPRAIRRLFHSRFPRLSSRYPVCVDIGLCAPPNGKRRRLQARVAGTLHVPIVPMSVKAPVVASMLYIHTLLEPAFAT